MRFDWLNMLERFCNSPWSRHLIAAFGCVLLFAGQAIGRTEVGPFEITGFYQFSANPATGHANPNNFGLVSPAGKPHFLLMRQMLDLRAYGKLNEEWSLFLQPRIVHDLTKSADRRLPEYQSMPTNFSGAPGVLLRAGGKDVRAEMWQAYVDYKRDNLWLRIGKQSIAWGEAVALRVLDVVNPLDLSQSLIFDRAAEEFDNIRVPQWFIRANYNLGNHIVPDLTAEFLFNPGAVVPTILPQQGSPYNVVPSVAKISDHVRQGQPTVGARLTGTLSEIQFSLNFLTKPNDDAVARFLSFSGLPFPPFARIELKGEHPRVYIVGGSVNYVWQAAGAVLRAETTITPNAPFQNGAAALKIVGRPVWKTVLAVDRPTRVFPGLDSLNIGLQFFETFTGGDQLHKVRAAGAKVDQSTQLFTAFLQQPLWQKRLTLEILGAFDPDGAHWLQPGAHWEIGNNVRLDLFYNEFGGSEKRAGRLGNYFWADGAFVRFTYGF